LEVREKAIGRPDKGTYPPIRVMFVTSEMVPYAKTGGLADVSAALPAALADLGLDLHVVLPLYRVIREGGYLSRADERRISVPFRGREHPTRVLTLRPSPHLSLSFIERDEFFDRNHIYGPDGGSYPDNADRYGFFSRAALELCREKDFRPRLLHCNDWQTALIPVYLKTGVKPSPPPGIPTLLTIHNLAYQGLFPPEAMAAAGLSMDLFTPSGLEFFGRMNYLKGGLVFSDKLNTVSPTYAAEIRTPEYGSGLDGVLRGRETDVCGILNGVDYSVWNPASDPLIAAPFGPGKLEGKSLCRKDLLHEMGLDPEAKGPVIGMVSRLAGQKGFDILTEAVPTLMEKGIFLVILGTGEPEIENRLKILARSYQGRMRLKTAFDNRLAHKIEAGADLFLMPSRYEPCGLNQMYSLKYGTVPIVRATGGLEDSVQAFDPGTKTGTGFKFEDYSAEALTGAVAEAVTAWAKKDTWTGIMDRGMAQDFSWGRSGRSYLALYERMLADGKK
jgi:starch synthase